MLKKTISNIFVTITFTFFTAISYAATAIDGAITVSTGALGALAPVGTPFAGNFTFVSNLENGVINLGGFCFTTTAVGIPPKSADCAETSSTLPILPQGETTYTGDEPAPGTVYDRVGTTFDGTSGLLIIKAYSTTFGLGLDINVTFNADGTGSMITNGGFLGSAMGTFTWQ